MLSLSVPVVPSARNSMVCAICEFRVCETMTCAVSGLAPGLGADSVVRVMVAVPGALPCRNWFHL
jgi:hypothetical protein